MDWRDIWYRERADSTSVAGKERERDAGEERASSSHEEISSATEEARKARPAEVCQGGICSKARSSEGVPVSSDMREGLTFEVRSSS